MDMMEYGLLTEEEMNAIDQGSGLAETGNEEVKSAAAGALEVLQVLLLLLVVQLLQITNCC